ncbi:unnamed protein product, partial [Dovyalis caffra]
SDSDYQDKPNSQQETGSKESFHLSQSRARRCKVDEIDEMEVVQKYPISDFSPPDSKSTDPDN